MYNILIANHNKSEREALISALSQATADIEHVYEAENASKAVGIYEKYQPDIIVLDIELPGMKGLECAKSIKKLSNHRQIKFIVQTIDQNLQYVQEALAFGVEDYILKPIDPQHIALSIIKVINHLQIEKNSYQQILTLLNKVQTMSDALEDECVKMILTKQNELVIQRMLLMIHMNMKYGLCLTVANCYMDLTSIHILKNDIADIGYFSLIAYQCDRLIILLMHTKKIEGFDLESIKTVLMKHHIFEYEMGIGHVAKGIHGLYDSYLIASANIHRMTPDAFASGNRRLQIPQIQEIDCEQWVETLLEYIKHQDDAMIQKVMGEFVKQLLPLPAVQINIYTRKFIGCMKKSLTANYHVQYHDLQNNIVIVREDNKYQVLDVRLNYILHSLLKPIRDQLYQNVNPLTKHALIYIKNNYQKSISLNDVAKNLNVSPFYLSKLLNHELDKTFTCLVIECRMEQAKNLLKEHHLVKTVAGMIGFQSSSYFSRIFKKEIGITPTEYRDIFEDSPRRMG